MPTLRELLMAGDSKSGSYRPGTLSDVLLPVGDSKEETLAKLERAREFMGLPTYVEQLRRQEAGQTPVNPLEVLQAATSPIESVTAAPARAAAAKAQEADRLSEVVDAFKEQMGKDPKAASSGEAMAEKAGLEGKAAKTVGIGLDLALDPTNLLGAGATKAAIPLLGLVGALKAQREAKAAEVLAKPGALGFYSKLEDLILQKMGKSATPQQVMAIAREAKAEEVASAGLEELLKGKEKITKEEVLGRLAETRPQLQEVTKGGKIGQVWKDYDKLFRKEQDINSELYDFRTILKNMLLKEKADPEILASVDSAVYYGGTLWKDLKSTVQNKNSRSIKKRKSFYW